MKYLWCIPAAIVGSLFGWMFFAALPGVIAEIFNVHNAHMWLTDFLSPFAGAAGSLVSTIACYFVVRE